MAAPASKTIEDLNGRWTVNKSLSDSIDPVLVLQGISFLTRSAIRMANVTCNLKQYTGHPEPPTTAEGEVTYLESIQTASGLKGSKDVRCLDNRPRDQTDWLYGTTANQSRWATLEDICDQFLRDGWLEEVEGKTLILTFSKNAGYGWTATQVNGFQIINGERRYCTRSVVESDGKRAEIRLVFDYVS
ncbi:hypothetical protein EDB81DRAFT_700459 [Dactylonectria macrodidyma]|uniref:LCCL domain-containing protein n=1 Tax=Dactylonectria macrodidyma TaxID=307937 RepID=A0A9P9DMC6_9HYPO|nr:hypothetical protein EDB81DRAFT_700459 [Dactylonectria macrodidyma]